MTSRHRPDVRAAERATRTGISTYHSSDHDALMWPHVNQEDLQKPREFDSDSVKIAYTAGLVDEPQLNRHYTCFRDRDTAQTYGELVNFQTDQEAAELMGNRAGPAGHGLVVPAVQQRILRFLVDCSKEILHKIPLADLLKFPVLPDP